MKGKPGRPRLDPADPSVRVTLSMPAARFDLVYQTARAERQTVSEFIRESIARRFVPRKLPDPASGR